MTPVTLYHGSKNGLNGPIQPISRDKCDFGRGFYMGTDVLQPLTLVCGYDSPCLYTLELSLEGLSVLNFTSELDWAFFIALNRGKLARTHSALYQHYSSLGNNADIIMGKIANDRMFVVLDRFFEGAITDTALIACLSALDIGVQYVAKTQQACNRITIKDAHWLTEEEKEHYGTLSASNREFGISKADEICREHRRDGRFFDEIVESWEA